MTFTNKSTVAFMGGEDIKYLVIDDAGTTRFDAVESDDKHIVWTHIDVANDIRDYYNAVAVKLGSEAFYIAIIHVPTVTV